jgi:hypothetical protein
VIKVLLSCGAPTKARDGIDNNMPDTWVTFNGYTAAACLIDQYSQTQGDTVEGQRGSNSNRIKSSRSGLDSSFTTDLATGEKMTQFSSSSILLSEEKAVNE